MNTKSLYPSKVDNLIFFQDVSLDNKEIFLNYQNLLSQKLYEESALYIKESGIPYYGAELFNLIENMISNTQKHLLGNKKPQLFYFTDDDSEIVDGGFGI